MNLDPKIMNPASSAMRLMIFVIMMTSFAASQVTAQRIDFAKQSGPYFVGEPVVVQIQANNFDASSGVPTCKFTGPKKPDVSIAGPRVGQSSSSFTQIINGRVSRRDSTNYTFSYTVTATKPGRHAVGPFEIKFGSKTKKIAGDVLAFEKIENDPDMDVELYLPQQTFYVGQKVPVSVKWYYSKDSEQAEINYAFSELQIRSPLFDQFKFLEQQRRSRTSLTISTTRGAIEVDASIDETERNGKDFLVLTGTQTMVAQEPGDFSEIPVSCRTKKVTRWGRDIFGDIVPRSAKPAISVGKFVSFTVKPIPLTGRPDTFSGTIGEGFSINVAANRSVVQVGDPISLSVTIKGDASLENASLPNLQNAGLDPNLFSIPSENATGVFDGQQKQFQVNVRVKDKSVTQIPQLTFSWFNPVKANFESATSSPIALQVYEGKRIRSEDVVSAATSNKRSSENETKSSSPTRSDSPSLIGANLAIEKDPTLLLATYSTNSASNFLIYGLYLIGLLSIVGALVFRARGDSDSELSHKKTARTQLSKQIHSAKSLGQKESAEQIADALRRCIVVFEPNDRTSLDRLISDCENQVYAQSQSTQAANDSLAERALEILDELAG